MAVGSSAKVLNRKKGKHECIKYMRGFVIGSVETTRVYKKLCLWAGSTFHVLPQNESTSQCMQLVS